MTDLPRRAAVYLRVSTTDQNVEHQKPACLELCRARGWEPIIIEETVSGAAARRPKWEHVMELVRSRQVAAVVVWKLDRVGRNLWAISDAVRAIDAAGVQIASVHEPWLTIEPTEPGAPTFRNLMVVMFDWMSAYERDTTLLRARSGVTQMKKDGRHPGRPRAALVGEPLAIAIELHMAGDSWEAISRELFRRGFKKTTRAVGRSGVRERPIPKATIHTAVIRELEFKGIEPPSRAAPGKDKKKLAS